MTPSRKRKLGFRRLQFKRLRIIADGLRELNRDRPSDRIKVLVLQAALLELIHNRPSVINSSGQVVAKKLAFQVALNRDVHGLDAIVPTATWLYNFFRELLRGKVMRVAPPKNYYPSTIQTVISKKM